MNWRLSNMACWKIHMVKKIVFPSELNLHWVWGFYTATSATTRVNRKRNGQSLDLRLKSAIYWGNQGEQKFWDIIFHMMGYRTINIFWDCQNLKISQWYVLGESGSRTMRCTQVPSVQANSHVDSRMVGARQVCVSVRLNHSSSPFKLR